MGWFSRKPRGRHALGAAVTDLPSGPLAAPEPGAPALAAPTPSPAAESALAPVEPPDEDLFGSIAALIATGDAWTVPSSDLSAPLVAAADHPAHVADQAGPGTGCLSVDEDAVALGGGVHAGVDDQAVSGALSDRVHPAAAGSTGPAAPVRELPAGSRLDEAQPYVPAQTGPRVSLGFRDGSTAALDPDSEQALALAELSSLLTTRD